MTPETDSDTGPSDGPSFLDGDAVSFAGPAWQDDLGGESLTPGGRIGPYRVLERLAVGGMSVVFLVERDDDQFRRISVLKVLDDVGLEPGAAARRFQAERQILATLDHPNIASVYDGGVTADGRPYLILEYVPGNPITLHAARRRLGIADRLILFQTVCRAVEHAHRRFIVHRDLKPANILVRDDGVVKLLDFGIAKLLDEPGGAVLPMTRTGLRLLTPEYAAPEQVRGDEITTATDVYALGVLLYEMVTGGRPYDLAGLSPAAVERTICEDDPPRPSVRVTRTPPDPGISDGDSLARRLRGDLDTIIMKALSKEPGRRYDSPGDLADDLDRHLRGLPVAARSASLVYLTRRSLWRYRLAAAAVVVIAGLGVFHLVQITRERNAARSAAARAEQVSKFLTELFAVSDPDVSRGDTITARDLLDRAVPRLSDELAGQPELEAEMRLLLGNIYHRLSLNAEAVPLAEEALRLRTLTHGAGSPEAAACHELLGRCRLELGDYEGADRSFGEALTIHQEAGNATRPRGNTADVARLLHRLGASALNQNRYERADSLLKASLAVWELQPPGHELDHAEALKELGNVQSALGNYQEAEPLLREALEIRRQLLGPSHSQVYNVMTNLGDNLSMQGRFDEAVPLLREGTEGLERILGGQHTELAEGLNVLGITLIQSGQYDAAEPVLKRVIAIRRALHGENNPDVARGLNDLGALYTLREDYASAVPVLRQSLAINRALRGDRELAVGIASSNLAASLRGAGEYDEAMERFRDAERVYNGLPEPDRARAAASRFGQATVYHERGDRVEAERRYRASLVEYDIYFPKAERRRAELQLALGRLLTETGRPEEALPLLEEATRTYGVTMGDASMSTARSRVALAGCLANLGQYARADSLLRSGLTAQEAVLPPTHPQLLKTHRIAIRHYEAWGRPAEAARHRAALQAG